MNGPTSPQRQLRTAYEVLKRFHHLGKRADLGRLERFYQDSDGTPLAVTVLDAYWSTVDQAIAVLEEGGPVQGTKARLEAAVARFREEILTAAQEGRSLDDAWVADCLKAHTQLVRQVDLATLVGVDGAHWQQFQAAAAQLDARGRP
ncbi:MAG: hypothetical protein ACFCBW_20120 [Candidatus Competibacterales bacterium]